MSSLLLDFSFSKLRNILEFRSTVTLQNYLNYLEEAFLIFILNRFSFKVKEQIKTPKKVYVADNGFCSLLSSLFSQDSGKLMENLVFVEIICFINILVLNQFVYITHLQLFYQIQDVSLLGLS